VVPENFHTYHKEGSWESREVSYAKNFKRKLINGQKQEFPKGWGGKGEGGIKSMC